MTQVSIAFECQSCHKADADTFAVAVGAPLTPEWQWKICAKCAKESGWVIVAALKPIVKTL